jgi:hypothetical protein
MNMYSTVQELDVTKESVVVSCVYVFALSLILTGILH